MQDWTRLLELAAGQLPGADPSSKQIGRISPLGMAVYVNFLTAGASTPQVVPVSAIMTDAFVDYANDFDHAAFIAQVKRMR